MITPSQFSYNSVQIVKEVFFMSKLIKVSDLRPHPINAQIYGKIENINDLLISISERGILEPIVVTNDGTIMSGHRRWRAAQELGIQEVPCRVVEYANDNEERVALIEHNRQRTKTFSQKMQEAEHLKLQIQAGSDEGVNHYIKCLTLDNVGSIGKRIDDIIGKLVGIGNKDTYLKSKKIWEAKKCGDIFAGELIEKLDQGRITANGAYKQFVSYIKHDPLVDSKEINDECEVIIAIPDWSTMSLGTIRETVIRATENSLLWFWTPGEHMHSALRITEQWRFRPRQVYAWLDSKEKNGQNTVEFCILATRGNPKLEDIGTANIMVGEAESGFSKPKSFYEMVDKSLIGAKLDLFSRKSWKGWYCGLE